MFKIMVVGNIGHEKMPNFRYESEVFALPMLYHPDR